MKNKIIHKIIISIFIFSLGFIIIFTAISSNNINVINLNSNISYEDDSNDKESSTNSSSKKSTSSKKSSSSIKNKNSSKVSSSKSSKPKQSSSKSSSQIQDEYQPIKMYNLNQVTLEELISIETIGEKTAQSIIDFRNQAGKFDSIEELQMVPGIGTKKFQILSKYLYCE